MQTPYDSLSPDKILDAVESVGLTPSGGLLALNSYENRVYQIEMDEGGFLVGKFYRPERWTDAAILEEHKFSLQLAEAEISVVTPIAIEGTTLFEFDGFRFALFPRQGGHPPNLENEDDLEVLSRTIARMHAFGDIEPFEHRRGLTVEILGIQSREYLIGSGYIPDDVIDAYTSTTEHLLERITPLFKDVPRQRIHGDCHMGNVLWRDDTPHFVDFDDCVMGPPVQDLWMLLSGERADQTYQLSVILDAYQEFFEFDTRTLALIEPLRTLRIMHHAAWIGRRWNDPAFPRAFPFFETSRYWSEHLLSLREQMAILDEPPLTYL
ncbi:MAG: serine/threonine protein kinase [Pseudomonadales bacterium]|nr:serine/threonine protein kinase [Pseudomonadales bacterium]